MIVTISKRQKFIYWYSLYTKHTQTNLPAAPPTVRTLKSSKVRGYASRRRKTSANFILNLHKRTIGHEIILLKTNLHDLL